MGATAPRVRRGPAPPWQGPAAPALGPRRSGRGRCSRRPAEGERAPQSGPRAPRAARAVAGRSCRRPPPRGAVLWVRWSPRAAGAPEKGARSRRRRLGEAERRGSRGEWKGEGPRFLPRLPEVRARDPLTRPGRGGAGQDHPAPAPGGGRGCGGAGGDACRGGCWLGSLGPRGGAGGAARAEGAPRSCSAALDAELPAGAMEFSVFGGISLQLNGACLPRAGGRVFYGCSAVIVDLADWLTCCHSGRRRHPQAPADSGRRGRDRGRDRQGAPAARWTGLRCARGPGPGARDRPSLWLAPLRAFLWDLSVSGARWRERSVPPPLPPVPPPLPPARSGAGVGGKQEARPGPLWADFPCLLHLPWDTYIPFPDHSQGVTPKSPPYSTSGVIHTRFHATEEDLLVAVVTEGEKRVKALLRKAQVTSARSSDTVIGDITRKCLYSLFLQTVVRPPDSTNCVFILDH